jgi:hypothetical protein
MRRNRDRKRLLGSTMLTLVSLFVSSQASLGQCTPELLGKFQTRYSKDIKEISAKELYSKYCVDTSTDQGVKLALPIDEVPVEGSWTSKSLVNACATRDENYFNYLKSKTEISFMPKDVTLELAQYCMGGLRMVGYEDESGIHLTAYYTSTTGENVAEVKSIGPTKNNQAQPGNATLNKTEHIIPGGSPADFTRVFRGDITFTLKTTQGVGHVMLPGDQFIRSNVYSQPRSKDLDNFWCYVNSNDNILKQTFDCRPLGSCGDEAESGHCKVLAGVGYLIPAGTRRLETIKDTWEIIAKTEGNGWACKRNGFVVGTIESPAYKNIKQNEGREALCAFKYSSTSLEKDPKARRIQLGYSENEAKKEPVQFR